MTNIVVMGDFNIYKDYEAPIDVFTHPSLVDSQCADQVRNFHYKSGIFKDSWNSLPRTSAGLTFSNMVTIEYLKVRVLNVVISQAK